MQEIVKAQDNGMNDIYVIRSSIFPTMMFVIPTPIIWKEHVIPIAVPWGEKKNTVVRAQINPTNQVNQEQQVHQTNHLKHASQQAGPTC